MEFLDQLWQTIAPYVAGISISGIISAIIYGCLKGAFNKTIAKINVEKIAENAADKGVDRVKKLSFTQSIQPICESELKKITEQANEYIKAELEETQKKYDALIKIFENFATYFDSSIGVTDEAKANVRVAIAEAKNKAVEPQSIKVEEEVVPVVKVATKGKNEPKTTHIER